MLNKNQKLMTRPRQIDPDSQPGPGPSPNIVNPNPSLIIMRSPARLPEKYVVCTSHLYKQASHIWGEAGLGRTPGLILSRF